MIARPCIGCGELTNASRCEECKRVQDRHDRPARVEVKPSSTERGYDARWRRLSERARKLSPICEDCNRPGTPDDPLTADHLIWPARTLADVAVVHRSCNSRRGARRSLP